MHQKYFWENSIGGLIYNYGPHIAVYMQKMDHFPVSKIVQMTSKTQG